MVSVKLTKYVTAWISGERQSIGFATTFSSLLDAVSDRFDFEIGLLRIYVLQTSIVGAWKSRIRLTADNFDDFTKKKGAFERGTYRLYACEEDKSPDGSPGGKKADDVERSQSSKGSSRSGQGEFRIALRTRDGYICVFCNSANDPLEAAHILPVELKELLCSLTNRTKYGIGSVNDSANGILLCNDCHKCFDSNLVCICPSTGELLVTDALLTHKREKWTGLVGRTVPVGTPWPTSGCHGYCHEN